MSVAPRLRELHERIEDHHNFEQTTFTYSAEANHIRAEVCYALPEIADALEAAEHDWAKCRWWPDTNAASDPRCKCSHCEGARLLAALSARLGGE